MKNKTPQKKSTAMRILILCVAAAMVVGFFVLPLTQTFGSV